MLALIDAVKQSKEPISTPPDVLGADPNRSGLELELERVVPFAPDVDEFDEYRGKNFEVRTVLYWCLRLKAMFCLQLWMRIVPVMERNRDGLFSLGFLLLKRKKCLVIMTVLRINWPIFYFDILVVDKEK